MRRNNVNIENIGKKRYFVARNQKGQFLARKPVKGSNLTLSNARELFRQGGSFYQDRERNVYTLKNYKEVTVTSSTYKSQEKDDFFSRTYAVGDAPKRKMVAYYCSGYYKNKQIAARSRMIDKNDPKKLGSQSQAIKEARSNFLSRLDKEVNGENAKYDADEGKKHIEDVVGYREGWVYYVAR